MSEKTLSGPEVIEGVYYFLKDRAGGRNVPFEETAGRIEGGDTMVYESALILSFGNEKNLFAFSFGKAFRTHENYNNDIVIVRIDDEFMKLHTALSEIETESLEETFAEIVRTKGFINGEFVNEGEITTGLVGAFEDGRIVCSGILRSLCGDSSYHNYSADGMNRWKPKIVDVFIQNMADLLTSYATQKNRRPHHG